MIIALVFCASLWQNCGTVEERLSLLRNFILLDLKSVSAKVQILLAACQRFTIVRISDNGRGRKKGLAFSIRQPFVEKDSSSLSSASRDGKTESENRKWMIDMIY